MPGAGIAPSPQGITPLRSPRCCRGEGLAVPPAGNFGNERGKGKREGRREVGWGGRLKLSLGVWVGKVSGISTELSSPLGMEVMEQQVEALVSDTHSEMSETTK